MIVCRKYNKWEFFLTGLIWGCTIFCTDTWNMMLIHMVKLHLPHMYMLLLNISKEKIISIYSKILPNLSILLGSYATFSSPSRRILWVRSNFFKDNICFFLWLWSRASRVFRSFSPIRYHNQLPHHFCSTANNGCRAQSKLFVDSKSIFGYLLRFQYIY